MSWRDDIGIFTCKDCPDRHRACHDTCGKYKRERAEWDAKKAAKRAEEEKWVYISESIKKRKNRDAKYEKKNAQYRHKYYD